MRWCIWPRKRRSRHPHRSGRYFRPNVKGGINLLDAMIEADVKRIVFSSTASIFGQPDRMPIDESADKEPVNSYGESKLQFERTMRWYSVAYGQHVSFRYFNACGATEVHGEYRKNETHIIPILFQVALGERSEFTLFGSDYPTPMGRAFATMCTSLTSQWRMWKPSTESTNCR